MHLTGPSKSSLDVKPIEENVDSLAEKLGELSILVRKSTKTSKDYRSGRSRDLSPGTSMICYFCKKPGYGTNKCEINLRRGTKCMHCGKIGHEVESFYVKKSSEISKVSFGAVESMTGDGTKRIDGEKNTAEKVGVLID